MRTFAIVKYTFATIVVALLLGAAFWYQSVRSFAASASVAEGTVVRFRRSDVYNPVVNFTTADGQQIEYTSSGGGNPPSYSRGDRVLVLYAPSEPRHAIIKDFFSLWGGPTILAVLGGVFVLFGGGVLVATRHTTVVKAKVQRVELNTRLSKNGRHPFRIVSHWRNPTTSELHVFRSPNLWFDPSDYLTDDEITVFIHTRIHRWRRWPRRLSCVRRHLGRRRPRRLHVGQSGQRCEGRAEGQGESEAVVAP